MGLFDTILGALVRLICGPQQQQQPSEPHKYEEHIAPPPPRPHGHRPPQQQQQQEQQQYYPPRPQPAPARPPHGKPYADQNQINQSNEQYKALRARANVEGDAMAKAFEESHQAYAGGDGARAKELSNKGKAHQAEMERLNREASEWIFVENNKDSNPGEVDLHGLYVKEAIYFTERAIQEAKGRGDSQVNLIVGKGLHSKNGSAKIKPAIEELMVKYNLVAAVDPANAGVLIVSLDGREHGGGRAMRSDELARGLERQDEGCFIM